MPLEVLILTDGKMGDLAQCRGLAQTLTDDEHIHEAVVTPGWLTAFPLPNMPLSAVDRQSGLLDIPADIVIASGRRTVPYLRTLGRRRNDAPFTVFLKDPRFNRKDFDLIWAPAHDGLSGGNVI